MRKKVILIIRQPATRSQIEAMVATLETYIKLAVDIRRGVLAGGGVMHADCEAVLLEDGSLVDPIIRDQVARVTRALLGGI